MRKIFKTIKQKWNWKIFATVVGSIIGIVVLAQLLWPSDRLLPFSNIAGESASFADKNKIEEIIEEKIKSQKIKLSAGGSSAEFSGELLSKSKVNEESLDEIFEYPLAWRFLPFSFLGFKADNSSVKFILSDESKKIFDEKAADLSSEAENAVFQTKDGKIEIKPSKNGQRISSKHIESDIQKAQINIANNTQIEIKGETIKPDISTSDYDKVKDRAEKAVAKNIYFMVPVGNKIEKYNTSAAERASLIGVKKNESGDQELILKDDELSKLFNSLEEKAKKTPGVTVVKMINGAEVGRTNGLNGLGLDFDKYKVDLNSSLFTDDNGDQIDMNTKVIPPTVRYEREFTKSNEGLQAYLDEATKGKKISISVQQLSGNYWGASSNGDVQMVSASTYKLYIAQYIMNKIDSGQLNWASPSLGTTVDGCFNNMIVRSANDCAENWISVYGRNNINSYLQTLGYGSVFSNNGSAASTTSNSLLKLLVGLHYGDGFSAGNAQKLIGLMSSQIYRQGIPAGTNSKVADKVGFLGNVLNDAGIVYHPKGNYAIVVMTEGESWGKIAEITSGIEKIMYEE